MFGYWVDEIARQAARLRFHRAKVPAGVVKINLGSGLYVADGWIHVDGSVHGLLSRAPKPMLKLLYRSANSIRADFTESEYIQRLHNHRFVFAQLEKRLPFDDAIADYIYSSHVLEHFFLDDARALLREIRRILKPAGTVRICVPDFDHAVSLHQKGDPRAALSYFFTESRAGYYRQHRYMYNYEVLSAVLRDCGFRSIQRCSFQQGRVPDLDKLDNRPEETLYVEAS